MRREVFVSNKEMPERKKHSPALDFYMRGRASPRADLTVEHEKAEGERRRTFVPFALFLMKSVRRPRANNRFLWKFVLHLLQ